MRSSTALAMASIALIAAACAADNGSMIGSEDDGNGAGNNGQGGNATGGGDTGGFTLGSGGSGNAGGMEECASESLQAEPTTLNVIVVLDRSGSMGQKWTDSVAALTDFFQDVNVTDTNVSMNFFPINNPPDNYACNNVHYNPPHVPFVAIPADAATLVAAMGAQTASGGNTPTHGALHGSLQYATAYQDANPEEVTIIVFASDGNPNGCTGPGENDTTTIANLAQSAYNYNGVETYVIAIAGSTIANLDQIAAAGGTGTAFDVTADTSLFKQKMEEIRLKALACEFTIPEPSNPNEFDPLKVNVNYTPGGSGPEQELPQADSLLDCQGMPGWYYDVPSMPTKILLCPASCNTVQLDAEAAVDIAFGCPTKRN